MEDLTPAEGSPAHSPNAEALADPQDPLRPEIEEEDAAHTPPLAFPQQDMEVTEDKEELPSDDKDDLSDDESVLSEIDEAQFEDFDPNAVSLEDRPVAVDQENVGLIGRHKRKRTEGEEAPKTKKREGRREKAKKIRKSRDDDDALTPGDEVDGKRRRRKDGAERVERQKRKPSPENEENLTPDESTLLRIPIPHVFVC